MRPGLWLTLGLALTLQSCAHRWGGPPAGGSGSSASPADELGSLRSERDDLRGRLRASQMREDTRGARNDAFPANGGMDTWQLENRLAELEHRIRALESAEAERVNTSTKKISP